MERCMKKEQEKMIESLQNQLSHQWVQNNQELIDCQSQLSNAKKCIDSLGKDIENLKRVSEKMMKLSIQEKETTTSMHLIEIEHLKKSHLDDLKNKEKEMNLEMGKKIDLMKRHHLLISEENDRKIKEEKMKSELMRNEMLHTLKLVVE